MPIITVKNYKGVEVTRIKDASSPENEEMQLKDVIIDKIVEANDIDVPQDLIDNEVTMMALELNHKMKYESMALGSFYNYMQDDMVNREEELRKEAFKLVKTRLVIKGIIETENFEVNREELEEEAKAISIRQQMPVEMVKDFLGQNMESLKDDLLIRKAIDFVYANAVIK